MKETLMDAKLQRVSVCQGAACDVATEEHLFGPERKPADVFLFCFLSITAVGFANPSVAISNHISWSDTIKGC